MENLISDFARFYILTLLYEGPTHGYQIITKFKRRVGKTLSPGLIYPFLQKLETTSPMRELSCVIAFSRDLHT
jgi:DNA-binding PadR family transcriptional regulator